MNANGLLAKPLPFQLLVLSESLGCSGTPAPAPSPCCLLQLGFSWRLYAPPRAAWCPPPGLPGADKSPTEAVWLWSRVSTVQGQHEGLPVSVNMKGGIEGRAPRRRILHQGPTMWAL